MLKDQVIFGFLNHQAISMGVVIFAVAIISLYAIYNILRLSSATRRTETQMKELVERMDLAKNPSLYRKEDGSSKNPFIRAWHTLLVHQKSPKDKSEASQKYLERHPGFYINTDLLKSTGLSFKKYHRVRQNIYLLAILFTFAGILLALQTMVLAFGQGSERIIFDYVPNFLSSVAVKFVASLVGILWMLCFGWQLGRVEDRFERKLVEIQSRIKAIFMGGFDFGVSLNLRMDGAAAELFQAVEVFDNTAAELTKAIKELAKSPVAEPLTGILEKTSIIEDRLSKFDPAMTESILSVLTKHLAISSDPKTARE